MIFPFTSNLLPACRNISLHCIGILASGVIVAITLGVNEFMNFVHRLVSDLKQSNISESVSVLSSIET
jgi:hypothetical protein